MQNSVDFKNSLNDLGYKDVAFSFSSNNGNQDNQNQRERNNQEYVMKYKEQNNEKLENELEIIIPDLIYG
ncbi:MAG: hypothetical protein QG567_2529 [Campylobacterota bacterium]|nr:hypothetical protein [Campylobacterota bacterium]